MKIPSTQKHLTVLLAALLSVFFFSCKKTEYVDYAKDAENNITSFKVQGLPQGIEPSIDQSKKIIRVYIPYYTPIDYVIATVKLDNGAVLFDKTGKELDAGLELEPVAVGDTTRYTVASATGVKKTYTVIHHLLPATEALVAKFSDAVATSGFVEKRVHSLMNITGNFQSTSKNAKVIFTNKQTGKVYTDFASVNNVVPGNSTYTMTLNVLPTALAGDYDVKIVHQGRTAALAPVRLTYSIGVHGYYNSTDGYAPGDTVVFKAIGYGPYSDANNGVFVGVDRIYLKIDKQSLYQIPPTFTDAFDKKQLDMKIVSRSRTEVKAIFPDAPVGVYGNTSDWSTFFPGKKFCGFGFYIDFNNETNWGKDQLFASPSSTFTIRTK